jgi:hypothetical protein
MTYLLILILNLALLFICRTDKRYWLVTISIWVLLTSSFFLWRRHNDNKISQLDNTYWKTAEDNRQKDPDNWRGNETVWNSLKVKKDYVKKYNQIFLNVIMLQTLLTFIAQIIGYKKTLLKRTYKLTSIMFGILLIFNFLLALLMAIVPTGPFF